MTERVVTARWGAVAAAGLTVFITAIDMNVVGVALPVLSEEFAVGPGAVQWVVLAYMLPLAALGLPVGRWADTVGRRQAFLFGVLGFGVASVLVAASSNLWQIVAARVLHGAFGALLAALALATVASSVHSELIGRAVGAVASLGPVGGAVGPALGGMLIEQFGWRSAFAINVPICALAAWLGRRSIPAGGGRLTLPKRSWLTDTAVAAVAGTALVLGLQLSGPPEVVPAVGLPLLALGVMAAIVWGKRRGSREAVSVLADGTSRNWLLALLCGGIVSGAVVFLTPFLLSGSLRLSSAEVGATMLAFPAGMALLAPLGGALGDRWGRRPTAVVGTLLILSASVLLMLPAAEWGAFEVGWRLALVGAGSGLLASPCQAGVMTAVPAERGATASAFAGMLLNVGFALGPALASLSWQLSGGAPTAMATGYATLAVASALALVAVLAVPSSTH